MTIDELMQAAADRRSVIGAFSYPGARPLPAAFVINMSFSVVVKRLPMMKIYTKQGETNDEEGKAKA